MFADEMQPPLALVVTSLSIRNDITACPRVYASSNKYNFTVKPQIKFRLENSKKLNIDYECYTIDLRLNVPVLTARI